MTEKSFTIVEALLGNLLALRRRGRYGLLFLDGHADFYQPEAEPNSEAASMDLALATNPANPKSLACTSERLECLSGDELFHQDDYADAVFVILEGEADILVHSPNKAFKIATLGKNDIIGEIAILCGVPRTATVVARGNLDILRVSMEGFFHLVTQFPQVGVEVMSAIASKLHRATGR
jgi:CRP/FNR family transcriptional regulator, cyclic AMP receptor protein